MKWSILVLSSICIVCCALENSTKLDEVQYKNHKTTSRNGTQNLTYKHPRAYPALVYTDPSGINEFMTEPPKTVTESPMDVVRVFITPTAGKRKQDLQPVVTTTPTTVGSSSIVKTTTNWVTTKSVIASSLNQKDKKSLFITPVASSTSNGKIISDFRPTVIATDDDLKYNKSRSNGTAKIKNAPKTQSQVPSNLIYATTTITTKVSSVNASKPFTTVLVPKQMLDGNLAQRDYVQDDSFRPIVPPVFSYSKQSVDANNIENRRMSNVGQTSIISTPKLTEKQLSVSSYKVQEDYPSNDDYSADIYDSRSYNPTNNRRDRIDQIYVPPVNVERLETEKPISYQMKYEPPKQLQKVQHNTPKLEIKYGFAVPESSKHEKQYLANAQPITDQFREFYPATEVSPIKDVKSHPLYNSAGKYETRPSVHEMAGLSFELSTAVPHKEFPSYLKYSISPKESNGHGFRHKGFSSSHDWPSSKNYETESETDKPVDDVDAKDVLKSLLLDMLKSSKQQSEVKPRPSPGMHEIIDSYFKTNRPNVDLSLDNYNIETDMSCNLRSSKHITDGQCVTIKPVKEAVCADRCLVYSSASPVSGKTQRSTGEQVEALHCVDGDSKLVRVQLKCRDGNTLNNVIKVVINCHCKLHQIQPQMRSNIPKFQSGPSQDVMDIAAGNF
ncbi:Hypothetical protein CINCED_3A020430 [Cinara cedri]|nr:Hypothetical protein CINCED_3A020430 [Cinara cedri]